MAAVRTFKSLIVRQTVGSLSIAQDSAGVHITSSHDVVTFCEDKTSTLVIYGLARCKYFSFNGTQLKEYIENSSKQTVSIGGGRKCVMENCMSRQRFTGPSSDFTLRSTSFRLTSITLDGDVSLRHIDNECIDAEGKIFNVQMKRTSSLLCPVNATRININMRDETTISTYRIVEGRRHCWCITHVVFEIDNCKRIEGIDVSHALTIRAPTLKTINAHIQFSSDCVRTLVPCSLNVIDGIIPPHPSSSLHAFDFVRSFEDESEALFGLSGDDLMRALRNGINTILPTILPDMDETSFGGDIEDDIVDQELLDATRTEWEADATPPPLIQEEKRVKITTLDKDDSCIVCMSGRPNVVLSCGHVILCLACTEDFVKYSKNCPLCRAKITRATYLVAPIQE